jgi:hypothetical protein
MFRCNLNTRCHGRFENIVGQTFFIPGLKASEGKMYVTGVSFKQIMLLEFTSAARNSNSGFK